MRSILTRLVLTIPVVWLVVSLVFVLIHLVPGDPILQMLGDGAAPADIDALRHQYHLDESLSQQYLHYWAAVLHGNLGMSIRLHDSVGHLIAMRYPYTLALTMTALGLGLALSLPAGILAAVRRGRFLDQALSVRSSFWSSPLNSAGCPSRAPALREQAPSSGRTWCFPPSPWELLSPPFSRV